MKEGPQDDVFALARALVTQGPVRFSNRSKSERAGALRTGGRAVEPAAPVKAKPPRLDRKATVEDAAVEVLNEMQHQIAANIVAAVETGSSAAPHQLRIGLRRLRVALGVLQPALGGDELDRLRARARDLGATVGALRDLDVFAEDMLAPAADATPGEPGFAPLAAAIAERRAATSRAVRETLAGADVAGFVLDLAGFVATRHWRGAGADREVLDAPIRGLARAALDHRWKALKKHAKGIETLPTKARHEMRKEIKKFRYLTEIFGTLYPKKKVAAFRRALRSLQDDFGVLNDAATAEAILTGTGSPSGFPGDAPAAANADAQRAAGRVIGAALAGAGHLWPRAVRDWRSLKKIGPFWR